MLQRFEHIRNVGRFANYTGSEDSDLADLTLVYGENGRGKTTLAAIIRSASTGEPKWMTERRQLGTDGDPRAVLERAEEDDTPLVFELGEWSDQCSHAWVFDDEFVDCNVHSGLAVESSHRQGLHQVVIGREGVRLARTMEKLTEEISQQHQEIRDLEQEFDSTVLGGMPVDDFCSLEEFEDIGEALEEARGRVSALHNTQAIEQTDDFSKVSAPSFPLSDVRDVLMATVNDIDAEALKSIKRHFESLPEEGEPWVSTGMEFVQSSSPNRTHCPFCDQQLSESHLFEHYRTYFSEAYRSHVTRIGRLRRQIAGNLSGDARASFLSEVSAQQSLHEFWSDFVSLDAFDVKEQDLISTWQDLETELLQALDEKFENPLTAFELSEDIDEAHRQYEERRQGMEELSERLMEANETIEELKRDTAGGDLEEEEERAARLASIDARYSEKYKDLCGRYSTAKASKAAAEAEKAKVREALDRHRQETFPDYQEELNSLLDRFGAGFRLEEMSPTNPSGYPSSEYYIVINDTRIPASSDDSSAPSFRSVLSAGDRNTLAFAFFIAALNREPDISEHIVIIDDPVSSMDEHRRLVTIREIRQIQARAAQTLVLSHSKRFLCGVHEHIGDVEVASIQVRREGDHSTIVPWDIHEESLTEYDLGHSRLRRYVEEGGTQEESKRVAILLRPLLEGYLRVACSESFPPGKNLGWFCSRVRQSLEGSEPILSAEQYDELHELNVYARRFHHDTNQTYDRALQRLNETELERFAERVLHFTTH